MTVAGGMLVNVVVIRRSSLDTPAAMSMSRLR
jgi:hypothetical protein